jgi:hypothetical protein
MIAQLLFCASQLVLPPHTPAVQAGFQSPHNGIFLTAHVNGRPEPLNFVLDSGAGSTLLDDAVAARLGIKGEGKGSIGGAGSGRTEVAVARNGSVAIGGVTLRGVDFKLMDLSFLEAVWDRRVDGIIGYDLLCVAAVTIDYRARQVVIADPVRFRPPRRSPGTRQ